LCGLGVEEPRRGASRRNRIPTGARFAGNREREGQREIPSAVRGGGEESEGRAPKGSESGREGA